PSTASAPEMGSCIGRSTAVCAMPDNATRQGAGMIDPEAITEAKQALGRQLAALRDAAGINQHQLAKQIHFGRSTIANAQTGYSTCSQRFWQQCDTVLDAHGALLRAYDELQALTRQQHRDVAELLEVAREATYRQIQGQWAAAQFEAAEKRAAQRD